MEVKTCEEYVLQELSLAQKMLEEDSKRLIEVEQKINALAQTLDYYEFVLDSLKKIFIVTRNAEGGLEQVGIIDHSLNMDTPEGKQNISLLLDLFEAPKEEEHSTEDAQNLEDILEKDAKEEGE